MTLSPENPLAPRLARVRLFIADVDGTLTDGCVYYGPEGEAFKKFNFRDGMGLDLWRRAGREARFCTRESSATVLARARKLDIPVWSGATDKTALLLEHFERENIDPATVAYIGDDVNDRGALRLCGVGFCPADAVPAAVEMADHVLERAGGKGAVREAVEMLLAAQFSAEEYRALLASMSGENALDSRPRPAT